MYTLIEHHVSKKDIVGTLKECINSEQYYTGLFLGKIMKDTSFPDLTHPLIQQINRKIYGGNTIKVQLLCNWCTSKQIADLWNKMSQGHYRWNDILIVWEGDPDYYVIINMPPTGALFNKKRTILFRMEPNMTLHPELWGEWADPVDTDFLKVCRHETGEYNNNEWHLSLPYSNLLSMTFYKPTNILSTVLSGKYKDPGHVKRVDFVKFLEKKNMEIHVYGDNKWKYNNYMGPLPPHDKNGGLIAYKYTFNAENHRIKNYYTEKLIDGILAECLVFYHGCPNIKDYIDERAYIQLELSNFEKDYHTIQKAINEDAYTKHLPYILEAKKKILNELQFFPRLEKIISLNHI
jgi:hypothetical protein